VKNEGPAPFGLRRPRKTDTSLLQTFRPVLTLWTFREPVLPHHRTGLRVASAATVPLSISMSVASISQSVIVKRSHSSRRSGAVASSLDAKTAES